jgi:hypothetical protein
VLTSRRLSERRGTRESCGACVRRRLSQGRRPCWSAPVRAASSQPGRPFRSRSHAPCGTGGATRVRRAWLPRCCSNRACAATPPRRPSAWWHDDSRPNSQTHIGRGGLHRTRPLHTLRGRSQTHARARRPVWPRGPTTLTGPHIPRTIASAWAKPSSPARTNTLTHHSTRSEDDHRPSRRRSPVCLLVARTYTLMLRTQRVETQPRPPCRRSPVWRQRPTTRAAPRTFRERPRTPRMGEALFGGPTHGARTNAVSREEHLAWPPVWDGAS